MRLYREYPDKDPGDEKNALRDEIDSAVEEYLRRGGEITRCPSGVSSDGVHRLSRGRGNGKKEASDKSGA